MYPYIFPLKVSPSFGNPSSLLGSRRGQRRALLGRLRTEFVDFGLTSGSLETEEGLGFRV